jgi:hypothetical protein
MSVTNMTRALRRSRDHWLGKQSARPDSGAYKEIIRHLRPDFDRVPSFAARVAGLETEYLRLADRQYELLLAVEKNPRVACTGGAGSGKTLLAIETARRAAAAGDRVLVTCRSRALASRIQQALSDSSAVCRPFDPTLQGEPFDVVVVDEAQDLMDLQSMAHLDALVTGGLQSGRWRIFCDVNNQANVDGNFDHSVFDEVTAGATMVELPFNCRNTAVVVHQTQMVTGADIGIARAGEGPPVEYRECPDALAAARMLDARLKELRQTEVPAEDVVVVTMKGHTSESAALLTKSYRAGRLVDGDKATTSPGTSQLVTAADIKGLEAPHVCVIDVEETREAIPRARLYVAMTRPRISLWVALSSQAWRQLAQGTEERTDG